MPVSLLTLKNPRGAHKLEGPVTSEGYGKEGWKEWMLPEGLYEQMDACILSSLPEESMGFLLRETLHGRD